MKQRVILACLIILTLSACSPNKDTSSLNENNPILSDTSSETVQTDSALKNNSQTSTSTAAESISTDDFFRFYTFDFPEYEYKGKIEAIFDDRTFMLEDIPENIIEELAVNNFYFDIAGEYGKLAEIMGENESLTISVDNEKKHFDEGIYKDKNIIHDVSVLTVDDLKDTNDYFIDNLKDYVKEFGLIEYSITKVDITWEHSEASLERGPQVGDGRYERLYLFGKTNTTPEWKMYEVFWGEDVLK